MVLGLTWGTFWGYTFQKPHTLGRRGQCMNDTLLLSSTIRTNGDSTLGKPVTGVNVCEGPMVCRPIRQMESMLCYISRSFGTGAVKFIWTYWEFSCSKIEKPVLEYKNKD